MKKSVLLISLLLFSGLLQAKTLQQYLGHVNAMTAKFDQFVFNETTQEPETSTGRIAVLSPDRFRLEYNKPYKQVYVADGERLWSYDEDLEQVTVRKQDGLLSNSPAIVLGNPSKLDKVYVIKAQGMKQNVDWFYLTPKSADSQFDHIRLGFTGSNLYVMELYDSYGQRTQLRFSQLQYNPSVSKADFRFSPPADVDVIGDTEN